MDKAKAKVRHIYCPKGCCFAPEGMPPVCPFCEEEMNTDEAAFWCAVADLEREEKEHYMAMLDSWYPKFARVLVVSAVHGASIAVILTAICYLVKILK